MPDLHPAELSPEIRWEFLMACKPNPMEGKPVRLIAPYKLAGPRRLRMGHLICPCPCCGALMVTLDGLPGFFPASLLEVDDSEVDTDDAD